MYISPASAPQISLNASHPPPSYLNEEHMREKELTSQVGGKMDIIYPIRSAQKTLFPDRRLIQYDCGKYAG